MHLVSQALQVPRTPPDEPAGDGLILPLLTEWVRLNHAGLLTFWTEGETWDRHRVSRFLDGLRPVGR